MEVEESIEGINGDEKIIKNNTCGINGKKETKLMKIMARMEEMFVSF